MAKDRLGKIEKWILKYCYLKTVKHELPENWYVSYDYRPADFDKYLTKAEVLLNYFDLEYSRYKGSAYNEGMYFAGYHVPDYQINKLGWHEACSAAYSRDSMRNRAMVSFTRAKNSLIKKNLIRTYERTNYCCRIYLTSTGLKTAEKILNVNPTGCVNNKKMVE